MSVVRCSYYMDQCPFCSQLNIEKQKIFETDNEYVLYNIRKSNRGRCLVVPKRHVNTIRELTDFELESLFKTIRFVSTKLHADLKPQGINYGFNEGEIAGQVVPHFHVHIYPRFDDDNVTKYHLFHSDPAKTNDWNEVELSELVFEFRKIFQ